MFGFDPTNFSDPFDVNKVAETKNRERAKELSQSFLIDSDLGGKAIGIFGKNKAEDIAAKAQASANRTASNAAGISGIFNAVGSIGSFGAAGGFGGGAVPGDGGAAAGLTTPWDTNSYDFFKDTPSFIGDTYDINSSLNSDWARNAFK
jgi:hypothetical protein